MFGERVVRMVGMAKERGKRPLCKSVLSLFYTRIGVLRRVISPRIVFRRSVDCGGLLGRRAVS